MPYAEVNGLDVYYEEHGAGEPLVLLHGGLMTIDLNFGQIMPELAKHHRVVALEFQGHGRTADSDRPMRVEHLAADVVGLLDHLDIARTDIFGFSLGGLTAYELLVHHASRIGRAVVASADHRNERGGEAYPDRLPTQADFVAMRTAYTEVAPDPTQFESLVQKAPAMVAECQGWTDEQIGNIEVPVLVLLGDTDFILVPNAARTVELLPCGQLAVLPATTHMGMISSRWITPIVEQFLRG